MPLFHHKQCQIVQAAGYGRLIECQGECGRTPLGIVPPSRNWSADVMAVEPMEGSESVEVVVHTGLKVTRRPRPEVATRPK